MREAEVEGERIHETLTINGFAILVTFRLGPGKELYWSRPRIETLTGIFIDSLPMI